MATPVADAIALTGDARIDGLAQGGSWVFAGPRVLTYSLNINFDDGPGGGFIPGSGGNWTGPLGDAFGRALTAWSNVANITFQLANSGTYFFESSADIAAAVTGNDLLTQVDAIGFGIFPDAGIGNDFLQALGFTRTSYPRPEGDVFFDNYYEGYSYLSDGGYGFDTMLHEVGHALGLKHPSDDGENDPPTFAALGISQYDAGRYTIMSTSETGPSLSHGNVATPMPLDILAIQHVYGANMSFHTGNDTYMVGATSLSPSALRTVWDAGGVDTFDASNSLYVSTIDLRPGEISNGTAIAYNVTIENAIGSAGSDIIIGNDANNNLDGRGGVDQFRGGKGNDSYTIGWSDLVTENPGEGTDAIFLVLTSADPAAGKDVPANVENFTVLGTPMFFSVVGNASDNVLTGNSERNDLFGLDGSDTLIGHAGNDVLDAGSAAWIDTLIGGVGDDSYVIRNTSSTVTENPGEGTDTLYSDAAFINLPDNVENLSLMVSDHDHVTGNGNALDNIIDAFFANDYLRGFAGNDTLSGGWGNDRLDGGPGDDYLDGGTQGTDSDMLDYSSAAAGVAANLEAGLASGGAGNDTVLNFEDLVGSGFNDALTGNTLNNYIAGGAGNDRLDGGLGDDYLDGGADSDMLDYASAEDGVTVSLGNGAVSGGAGIDTVLGFEDLRGSAFNDALAGNALNNYVAAGAGNDRLDGGPGDDYLDGGTGSDLLDYASAGAYVTVYLGAGTATGGAGNDTLLGFEELQGSGFDDALTGSSLNDYMLGGAGNDYIAGVAGNDRLDGESGDDYLDGGADSDLVDYTTASAGVTVNLGNGTASGGAGLDTLLGFEDLRGSSFADALTGNALGNYIDGAAGNDRLDGGRETTTWTAVSTPTWPITRLRVVG